MQNAPPRLKSHKIPIMPFPPEQPESRRCLDYWDVTKTNISAPRHAGICVLSQMIRRHVNPASMSAGLFWAAPEVADVELSPYGLVPGGQSKVTDKVNIIGADGSKGRGGLCPPTLDLDMTILLWSHLDAGVISLQRFHCLCVFIPEYYHLSPVLIYG